MTLKRLFLLTTLLVTLSITYSQEQLAINDPTEIILGNFAVSPTGAATYSIPIDCPKGLGDLQPNIALNYNSQAGENIAGLGWGLSGISAISLRQKTIQSDNAISGIDIKKHNKFTLNGNNLVLVSGTYGRAGSIYKFENDDFSRITCIGNALPEYPALFKVETKDGKSIEYSHLTFPNRLDNNKKGEYPCQWLISRITDKDGNYINFQYINTSYGSSILNKIEYTGNSNNAPNTTIEFKYSSKEWISRSFLNSYYTEDGHLLNQIIIKSNIHSSNEILKRYQLEYIKINKRNYLKKVSLYNSEQQAIGETCFLWGDDNKIIKKHNTPSLNLSTYYHDITYRAYSSDDIDGDGVSELIEFFHRNDYSYRLDDNNYQITNSSDYVNIYKTKYENGKFSISKVILNEAIGASINFDDFKSINGSCLYVNLLGRQEKTLIAPTYNEFNGSKGTVFSDLKSHVSFSCMHSYSNQLSAYASGDINNDGIDEIISIERFANGTNNNNEGVICYIQKTDLNRPYLSEADKIYRDNLDMPVEMRNPRDIIIEDFDGDGLKDICVTAETGTYIFNNLGGTKGSDGIVHATFNYRAYVNLNTSSSQIRVGDFNGDKYPDFLVNEHCNTSWKRMMNTGDFYFTSISEPSITAVEEDFTGKNDDKDDCIIIDFDHDGMSDVIIIDAVYDKKDDIFSSPWGAYNHTDIIWYRSTGNGMQKVKSMYINDENYTFNHYNTIGDFDGDGQDDLFSYKSNIYDSQSKSDDYYFYAAYNNNFNSKLIKSIIDGRNNKIDLLYQPLTYDKTEENTAFYTKGNSSIYPMFDLSIPLYCVKRVITPVGHTLRYSYHEAIGHYTGKGFLGFKKMVVNNDQTDFTTTNITIWDNSKILPSQTVETITDGNNQRISHTEVTLSNFKINNSYQTRVSEIINIDYLKNQTKRTTFANYDSYNNPLKIVENYGDNYTITTDYKYYNSTTPFLYLLGQPITTTRKIVADWDTRTEKEEIRYNDARKPISKTTSVNGYKTGTTFWTYTQNGELETEKSAAYESDNLLGNTYSYNSRGLLQSVTNELGQKTSYSQYNKWGIPEKVEDFKKNVTTYIFDDWGRNTKIIYPDSVVKNIKRSTSTSIGAYCITTTTTGEPEVRIYYDKFDREVRNETKQFDGSWLKTDKQYDNRGNIQRISIPYIGNSTVLWNTYSYDSYGRPITYKEPSDKTTSWSYNGNSITETLNNVATTRTYNALGQLIKVDDPSGSVTYKLTADGRPIQVNSSGIQTSFEYDNYDRQTAITDPSAGRKSFTYDIAGNLTSETDANGNIVKYTYDNYDRKIRQEYVNELVTNYVYNTDGLLESETSDNGTWTKYQYDNFGRLIDEFESAGADEMNLHKMYTYENNHISEIAYASEKIGMWSHPMGVEKYEYANGHLKRILMQNQEVWSIASINDQGFIAEATTGPLKRSYLYNAYGHPTSRVVTNKNTNSVMQSFSYQFSPSTGNLEWRKDNRRNLQENFTYDNLNRLTDFGNANATYDNKGNITRLSTVGTLSYSTTKPYAISAVTLSNNSLLDTEPQNVTYNVMGLPNKIVHAGKKTATFTYNGNGERVMMAEPKSFAPRIVGGYNQKHYYLNNKLEIIYDELTKSQKFIFYIGGDAYSAPAVYIQDENSPLWKTYYICRDYLGSITLITDASGNPVQELSYDAWGNLRNPATQKVYASNEIPELFLGRGYTGHEHLVSSGLINMNARLYDPTLGRFLSPDPHVQMPDNLQNFNRYTYCLNNPLLYTDPSGEAFVIDDLFLILGMAYIGGIQANISHAADHGKNPFNPGNWNWGGANTYIGVISGAIGGAGMAGYSIPGQLPGILTNGSLQAGVQVGLNGIGNVTDGRKFFDDWYWAAGRGFLSGATIGYRLANESELRLNYWWGNEVAYGRTQWSFINSELPMTSIDFNIQFSTATANNTCVPQSLAELEASKGGTRTEADFRLSTNWSEKGVTISNTRKFLSSQGFKNSEIPSSYFHDPSNMQEVSNRGNNIILHERSTIGHMTPIKRIDYYQSGKIKLHGRGRTYKLTDNKLFYFLIR